MKRNFLDKIDPAKKTLDQGAASAVLNVDEIKIRLLDKFPLGLVPRNKINEATGGVLHQNTMANMDSKGGGIVGRVMIGNKTCYPIDGILAHILNKVKETVQC